MTLQNSLANFSFLSLLGSMVFYWIGTSFRGFTLSSPTKTTESGANTENKPDFFSTLAKYGILFSNLMLGFLLVLRWKESGHFPLSNLYESLMFLSWCFTLIHLFIENYTSPFYNNVSYSNGTQTKDSFGNGAALAVTASPLSQTQPLLQPQVTKEVQNKPATKKNLTKNIIGAITTPSALLTNAFATFTLPKEMQEASPLVPALQSNWLMMHVTVMILSYAALIIGSLLSIAFLIVTFESPGEKAKQNLNSSLAVSSGGGGKSQTAIILDNLSYRILGIGFPFLTIGILSGAVWANEAWGSYWSWDPKETWALLTWLIFAIYLHTRLSKGWEGKKPAIIASFGLVIVWICYLGVNLIGEGLHSYGWITT